MKRVLAILLTLAASPLLAELPSPTLPSPFIAVDLAIGESETVALTNGYKVAVKLIDVKDYRDSLRGAVRGSEVKVEVAGQPVKLGSATYHLPVTVGKVRVDCPVTKGYIPRANKLTSNMDAWGLEKDARLRLWP